MAGPSADHIAEWEGGSLSELVAMLQAAAQPVRIEVIAPGTTDSSAGEVHLLAGGMADAFAGSLRRDDAMAALQRLEGARYLVECRLPNPESGSLSEPGPHEGNLKDRPLASLMRYCEDYVLTCRLEVWRGQDRAVISYRRGEIIGTIVGGSEGSDRLPEVLAWNDGVYEIILPAPVLPQMPSRSRDGAGARAERKRHTTLPMMPGSEAKPDVPGGSQTDASAKSPLAGTGAATTAPTGTARAVASGTAAAPPPRPGSAQPAQPAIPMGGPRVSPPSTTPRPASQPTPQAVARPPLPQAPVAHKIPAQQPQQAAITPKPVAMTFASPLQPEMTTRGTPPIPAVPLVPSPAPQPAARPTAQGTGVPLVLPKPATPAQAKAVAPASQPAPQPSLKPAAVQLAPQPSLKPVTPQSSPLPLQKPAAAQPAPQTPQKPAPAQAPQLLQKPPAVSLSAPPTLQPSQKPAPPAVQPAPAAAAAAQPPAQAASPTEKPQAAPARPSKPAPSPAISNDLLPASGTIEAKPQHGNYLPPTTPPIQIADEPQMASAVPPSTPVLAQSRPPKPRRTHAATQKGSGERPVRVYVFLGLAIGMGIVLAYWAYWYLPFGHH